MFRIFAFAICLWAAAAGAASAYSHRSCYSTPLRFRGDVGTVGVWGASFPVETGWRAGVTDAFTKVNAHPGNYRLDMGVDTYHVSPGNGESEVWFSRDHLWANEGSATAHYYDICVWFFGEFYYVNEVDVIIDADVPWTLSENKRDIWNYGGEGRPFAPILIHELGHGLGFSHNDYSYNVMGDDFSHLNVNGSRAVGYVGEDLSAGIIAHYGPKAAWTDVAVTHWRYMGSDGEYSIHDKTDIIGAGGVLPFRDIDGETHFDVTPGQWLFAQFTFEDLGIDCRTTTADYFFSTNATITTADRWLVQNNIALCTNRPNTRRVFIRLPADLRRGAPLWLGVVLNRARAFPEADLTNNAAYVPLWVN